MPRILYSVMIRVGTLHALGGSLLFISMMPFFLPFVIPNIWEEIAKPTKKKSLFGSSKKQQWSPIIADNKEDERAVLRSIWKRATKSQSECDALSHHNHHTQNQNTNNNTRVKNDLPSGGVANAIKHGGKNILMLPRKIEEPKQQNILFVKCHHLYHVISKHLQLS